MKQRCTKMIKKGLMTERRQCLRPARHNGWHSPDLMGMQFQNLHVVAIGQRHARPSGQPLITWTCQDHLGRMRPNIYTGYLITGVSRGVQGPRGDGRLTPDGYRKIRQNGRQVLEHRIIMAKILGRPLRADEQVHHGPKGRACNEPENLSIRLKGNHPQGHSVHELANWLRSLGCQVIVPVHLADERFL